MVIDEAETRRHRITEVPSDEHVVYIFLAGVLADLEHTGALRVGGTWRWRCLRQWRR